MKACPTCHIAYPSHFVICPRDATRLIEADEWPEGTLVRGRYRILGKLGRGGMGAVYKALHTKFDQFRALKVMVEKWAANPESIQRFERANSSNPRRWNCRPRWLSAHRSHRAATLPGPGAGMGR